ncbi:MAG: ribosome silencing factor [Propioniciclava sp.]
MAATDQARQLTRVAAGAADSKQATQLVAFDVSERFPLADIFLIASAANERQVAAIVDAVDEALFAQGVKALRTEGGREARWVLVDFGDLVLHVQHVEERELYSLDRLWRDCPEVDLELAPSES